MQRWIFGLCNNRRNQRGPGSIYLLLDVDHTRRWRLHIKYTVSDPFNFLIAASYGEGFGLPLIEAAQHKLPNIARDIPVFREVAGDHAFYFDADDAQGPAASIQQWLALYGNDAHPRSDKMPWLTWKQSAALLCEKLLGADFDAGNPADLMFSSGHTQLNQAVQTTHNHDC